MLRGKMSQALNGIDPFDDIEYNQAINESYYKLVTVDNKQLTGVYNVSELRRIGHGGTAQ